MNLFTSITDCSSFRDMGDQLQNDYSLAKLMSLIDPDSPPRSLGDVSIEELNDIAFAVCDVLTPDEENQELESIGPKDGIRIVKMVYVMYVRWFCEIYEYKPMVEKKAAARQVDESLTEISKYAKIKYDIALTESILSKRLSVLYPAALIVLPGNSRMLPKIKKALDREYEFQIENWPYDCADIYKVYPYQPHLESQDSWKKINTILDAASGILVTLYDNSNEHTCRELFEYQEYVLDSQKKYLDVTYSSFNAVNRFFFPMLAMEQEGPSGRRLPSDMHQCSTRAVSDCGFGAIQLWTKLYSSMFHYEHATAENMGDKEQLFERFKPFRDQMNEMVSMRNRYMFA